ncbi:MAG: hypothetical protein AB1758_33005, partial [Candidatus Eremiobacterota bacterium]
MLKVNETGTFVYLKKEFKPDEAAFAEEQKRAVYRLNDQEHQLVFDGKVDQVVLGKMSRDAREHAITDIKALAPVLDAVAEARPAMDAGQTVELDFGQFGTWKGVRQEADYKGKREEAFDYVFTPAEAKRYQTAVFTDNGYVKLQTNAYGVRHEVTGRAYRDEESGGKRDKDSIFYISEMVGVTPKPKKGKATAAAAAPPE